MKNIVLKEKAYTCLIWIGFFTIFFSLPVRAMSTFFNSDSYNDNTSSSNKYEPNYGDTFNTVYFEWAHFHRNQNGLYITSKICIKNLKFEKNITIVEMETLYGQEREIRRSNVQWNSSTPPFADNHQVISTNDIYDCFNVVTSTSPENHKVIFKAQVQMDNQIYFSGQMTVLRPYLSNLD